MSLIEGTSRAGVAQLVEQRTCNAKVEGSTPFSGTTLSCVHTRDIGNTLSLKSSL